MKDEGGDRPSSVSRKGRTGHIDENQSINSRRVKKVGANPDDTIDPDEVLRGTRRPCRNGSEDADRGRLAGGGG
jgi:hypothetical protein